jgi:hypothetical protein
MSFLPVRSGRKFKGWMLAHPALYSLGSPSFCCLTPLSSSFYLTPCNVMPAKGSFLPLKKNKDSMAENAS